MSSCAVLLRAEDAAKMARDAIGYSDPPKGLMDLVAKAASTGVTSVKAGKFWIDAKMRNTLVSLGYDLDLHTGSNPNGSGIVWFVMKISWA